MSVRNQPKIHEANRRPKGRHPLFCFISFIGIYYPLTDIVIVHIVCNPSAHTSTHSGLRRRRRRISLNVGSECDHLPEAGNNNYLGSECDHLPEAGNTYIGIHPFAHPSAHPYYCLPPAGVLHSQNKVINAP